LTYFAELVNRGYSFSGKTVYLTSYIDMSSVNNWTPIGDKDHSFDGTFDGKGYTISNLSVNATTGNAGLFYNLKGGIIQNLNVDTANITGTNCVGVISGEIFNTGTITKCSVIKATVNGNHYVGGIVGYAYGTITDCEVTESEIKAVPNEKETGGFDNGDKLGGIVGWQSNGNITGNTVADVTLTAYRDVGGIGGYSNSENSTPFIDNNSVTDVTIIIDRSVDAGDNAVNANPIIGRLGDKKPTIGSNTYENVTFVAKDSGALKALVTGSKQITVNLLSNTKYTTNFNIGEGKNIVILGDENTVLDGQIATTSSTEGTLKIKDLTYNVENIVDSTNISQTSKSAIGIWGNQTVICENVKFVMSIADTTAISGWWDTGIGTTIKCEECTFDCNGQRPIRSCGNVTVEGCTFNDPYRYAVQLTGKASTATLIDKAVINFNDNTIINGPSGKDFVYGIQLEGETYGCNNLIINGSGNKIENGGTDSTMYYCECGKVDHSTIEWNTEYAPVHENSQKIDSPGTLEKVLKNAGAAGAGDSFIEITENLNMTNVPWTPIKVDGYNGADIVTINGNGKTITGLTAPLFAGGFAGGSGIVIRDLTIADSTIVSTNTIGSGAFIESVDSMQTITLINCHLKDSTVTGGSGSRTGGLIGWTAGYNNTSDGPVKTYVTIENCSVTGCTITCDGSVGGIYGHAGNNAWTFSTVKNCTVKDNVLNSTDDGDWRVGVVVGTANVGELTISGITESGNTLTQTGKAAPSGQSNLFGRFVPGETGILVIDGEIVLVSSSKVATDAGGITNTIENGASTVVIGDTGDGIKLPLTVNGKDLTFRGTSTDDSVITIKEGQGVNNANLTFVNITIATNNTDYTGIQHSGDVIYTDCVFDGSTNLYGKSVTFNNCTFNLTSRYIWTYGAGEVTFNNCTFNTDGKAVLIYAEDSVDSQIVNIINCTFNATDTGYTSSGDACAAVEIDSSLIKGTYTVNFSGNNAVDEDFNGLYRIKKDKTPSNVIINE